MKNLRHKLRMWLLRRLNGLPEEKCDEDAAAARHYYDLEYDRLNTRIRCLDLQIGRYKAVVQEICRRSDDTYYDWCCDYCATPCHKRNGWCKRFQPRTVCYVDIQDGTEGGVNDGN